MSWSWSLPVPPPPCVPIPRLELDLARTRVVVPTFRDWHLARETIDSLLECSPRPAEIVLVDDNAEDCVPGWVRGLPIILVSYPANRGPAFARNAGACLRTTAKPLWYCFTDTGCRRDHDFFGLLQESVNAAPEACIACAGPVEGVCDTAHARINRYMTVEGILNPPMDEHGPQAVVTANALVRADHFDEIGGFDCTYPFAAAEDLDLGIKLRARGRIAWVPRAVVRHRFEECEADFCRRFVRYGRGTAHMEMKLALPPLRPSEITALLPELQHLADLQQRAMLEGYEHHKRELAAGLAANAA